MKKVFLKILGIVCIAALGSGCDLQRTVLYHPTTGLPTGQELQAEGIRFWPDGRGHYRGFTADGGAANARGTFVVFHGNAGTAADRSYYVRTLGLLGFRVVLAEYPGYGGREGKPGEPAFRADGQETLRLAFTQYGGPLYVLGESLGAGVAATVVRGAPVPVDGVVLITPWDTLLSIAREKFPWLPVRLFLKDRYDTIGNLNNFSGPVAIVGAGQDNVIPVRHAETLFEALQGNKKFWRIEQAGHNDWIKRIDPRLWKEIMDFAAGAGGRQRRGGEEPSLY